MDKTQALEELKKDLANPKCVIPYRWLKHFELTDELPAPSEDGWNVPEEKWEETMIYNCKLKHWVYHPE